MKPYALSVGRAAACGTLAAALFSLSAGCGGEEPTYQPRPAHSGKAASIPPPPTLPQLKRKEGDAYTIAGVTHDLNSRVHKENVAGKQLTLIGTIVKTNLIPCKDDKKAREEDCTPACAVHKGGKEDPPDCAAPVPTFWIADSADEKTVIVPVMGWASNFAKIYDAIEEYDKAPNLEKQAEVKIEDPGWGINLPNPLPAVGAKVKVTGTYGTSFTRSTSIQTNPRYGILTVDRIEYVEPSKELANLPGMKERKPKTK